MTAVRRIAGFERYLSLWVAVCMIGGVALGRLLPDGVRGLSRIEIARVNVPIAVLIWLMIYPMMLRVDLAAIRRVGTRPTGLLVTLAVNWLVKPFTMAALAWFFFRRVFAPFVPEELQSEYVAGVILLAAAPCTAMVFVWSYLTDGDPGYTLVQVAINDVIMLLAFAPIVMLLLGVSNIHVPFDVLLASVIAFIVIPLAAGSATRLALVRWRGRAWFENAFVATLKPVAIAALLGTLVLIFAFQGDVILRRPWHIALIAVPLIVQTYFNAGLAYVLMHRLRVPHNVAAPGTLIGASNFFELAVATAVALFGLESGATLATVVGVLVEVPVMLSVCAMCNRTRGWFPA